jgi:hypothetical protein
VLRPGTILLPPSTLSCIAPPLSRWCRMRAQMTIGVGIMVLQQFSGINAIVFYRCAATHGAAGLAGGLSTL